MPPHVIRRSHGCRTCRRRRIRCDEQRPSCLNCDKIHVQCDGYEEPTFILNDDPRLRGRHQSSSKGAKKARTDVSKSSSKQPRQATKQTDRRLPPPSPAQALATLTETASSLRPRESSLSSSSIPSQNHDDDFFNHKRDVDFLLRAFAVGQPGDGRGFSWLRFCVDDESAADQKSISFRSVCCLGRAFYGCLHGDEKAIASSRRAYSEVLLQLRSQCERDFREPSTRYALMTSMMASVYIEALLNDLPDTFAAHIFGLGDILETCGPEAFQRGPFHHLFNVCRAALTFMSIKFQRATFLSEQRWLEVPCQFAKKSASHELWDVLVRLSKYLADPEPSAAGQVFLIERIQQLVWWRWRWEVDQGDSVRAYSEDGENQELSTEAWLDDEKERIGSLDFEDMSRAQQFSLYHATMALLLRLLEEQCPVDGSTTLLSSVLSFAVPTGLQSKRGLLDQPRIFPRPSRMPSDLTSSLALSHLFSTFKYTLKILKQVPGYAFHFKITMSLAYRAALPDSQQRETMEAMLAKVVDISKIQKCGDAASMWHIGRK